MSRNAVVVGAGQGGLVAACYLAHAGLNVTVIEQRGTIGGKAARQVQDGFTFDPGPSIVILPRIYREVFDDCGAAFPLVFDRLDPVTRLLWADSGDPIDLAADLDACVSAFEPADAAALRRLFSRLGAVAEVVEHKVLRRPVVSWRDLADLRLAIGAIGLGALRPYRETVDRLFGSPLLRALFYGFPSYSGLSDQSRGFGPLFIPYYMWSEGVWSVRGGVGAIPEAFGALAESLGAKTILGCRANSVRREAGGRIVAIETDQGELEADIVVSNVDRLRFGEWLGRRPMGRPATSYATVSWGLRERPSGLAHHTLVIPRNFEATFDDIYRRRVPPREPIVYLNDASDPDSPAGKGNVFAVMTVPGLEPGAEWSKASRDLSRQARAALNRVVGDVEPLTEFHQDPRTFDSRDGNMWGSLYGADESGRGPFGMPLTNIDPEVPNLFYCGGSVQPGAGLPMVTLGGATAARLALHSKSCSPPSR